MLLGICLGILSGCGYHLAGQGSLPGGVERITINVLENRSTESGIETKITNALINEFNRRRPGGIVDIADAQAVLAGTIDTIAWNTLSHRGVNIAAERRVSVSLSLALTDTREKVLWKRSGLSAEQAYAVVNGNKPATESNRRRAIELVAQRVSETVYQSLVDNF